ncbi:MAG: type II toxin-antitoxin system RelE/ParE family toxin [Mesorhizobium sp.]
MAKLTITPIAREDLKEIGRYTQRTWGAPQRNAYLSDFAIVFERLRTGSARGRNQFEVGEGIISHPCNRHMIFFRRDSKGDVEILRILHERMDFMRHF